MNANSFKLLTGHLPLSWQVRLHDQWVRNEIKSTIDLPTGLGKTMVMAIWLIARRKNPKLGRRLIYVVDRRTVVDQATDLAEQQIFKNFAASGVGGECPAISTLRGELADNRAWSRDPSRPAIIIGTVDMIGSRLLFNGYRSSYKARPLHAGLLGRDSLLVLDEAHLSTPFEKLLAGETNQPGGIVHFQSEGGRQSPLRIVRMSATTSNKNAENFKLEPEDLRSQIVGGEETNIIVKRFKAKKRLTIETPVDRAKLNGAIASAAAELAKDNSRVVVFVRSPDDATKIAGMVRQHGSKKSEPGPFVAAVEVLTGTMRGFERDKLLGRPVLKRFLDGDEKPEHRLGKEKAVLVSTSAGEVGFDLNADHMICDAAPLDSMIQRLGRVNRRGDGSAIVKMFIPTEQKATTDFDAAVLEATKLLKTQVDVSPKALATLKSTLTNEEIVSVSSPKPATVDLTDILLDAWSMTSIIEPMPNRPEVAPWLRGIADDLPETTISWRAELDLDGFDEMDGDDLEEWFDTHGVAAHETLSVPTRRAAEWFIGRWDELHTELREKVATRSCIIDRGGLRELRLIDLIDELRRNRSESIRNADVILPASFGGIETGVGLLDSSQPIRPERAKFSSDDEHAAELKRTEASPDVADNVADKRKRSRLVIKISENGEAGPPEAVGSGTMPDNAAEFIIGLPARGDYFLRLISYIPKRDKPEFGFKPQSLKEHVELVKAHAAAIASRLPELTAIERAALELAAAFHDHGKNCDRWQRLVCGEASPSGADWTHKTLGKSGGKMFRDPSGYRHEFGSLRQFIEVHQHLLDKGELDAEVFDLAAHLIVAHHGRGRPHFPKGGFDPDCPQVRAGELAREIPRRFARLQRKYGHWGLAYLESLLCAADALASQEEQN